MAVTEMLLLRNSGTENNAPVDSSDLIPPEGLGWWSELATSAQALIRSQSPLVSTDHPLNDSALARLIVQVLPVALFYHENLVQLEAHLSRQERHGADPSLRDSVICIGSAIALLCQEQASPSTLIPQLLSQTFWSTQTLPHYLLQVQALLQDHASLATVKKDLGQQLSSPTNLLEVAIAFAIFCWASTPDSFCLTISRGKALSSSSQLPTLIACALSGIFNGLQGIPVDLQGPLLSSSSPLPRQDILDLADHLLAVWSGCYAQGTLPWAQTVVAAPGVLRPRG